jgi:hypothetical protein
MRVSEEEGGAVDDTYDGVDGDGRRTEHDAVRGQGVVATETRGRKLEHRDHVVARRFFKTLRIAFAM